MERFSLPRRWVEVAGKLSDAERGQLYQALFGYAFFGKKSDLPGTLGALYDTFKRDIDAVKKRSKAAKMRKCPGNVPANGADVPPVPENSGNAGAMLGQCSSNTGAMPGQCSGNAQANGENVPPVSENSGNAQAMPEQYPDIGQTAAEVVDGDELERKRENFPPVPPFIERKQRESAKARAPVVLKPASFLELIPENLRTDEFAKKWLEWEDYRRKRRKPLSEFGARGQLKMLSGFTVPEALEIIGFSMTNDYQGLFPPRGRPKVPVRDYTGV